MGDELYIESFSSQERDLQEVEKPKNSPLIENNSLELYEFTHQMHFYLEKLREEITKECGNFSDFIFVFERIRHALKEKDVERIPRLLADLEELLDVELPLMALKAAASSRT